MYPHFGFAVSGAALLMLERLSTFIQQVHQGRSLSAHKSQGCSRCETSSEPYSGGHRVYHVSTTLSSTATVTSFGCGIGTASMLLMLLLSVHLPQSYSTHLLCGSPVFNCASCFSYQQSISIKTLLPVPCPKQRMCSSSSTLGLGLFLKLGFHRCFQLRRVVFHRHLQARARRQAEQRQPMQMRHFLRRNVVPEAMDASCGWHAV